MSLFATTLITGLFLLACGVIVLLDKPEWRRATSAFPRSMPAAIVTMGIGGAWFLYKILHLSQADFGDYKNILLVLFGATILGSFVYVKDFLAVRGAAIITLLVALEWLKSAFALYEIPQRLFLVGVVYVAILIALYLGAVPFKMRDFLTWLFAKPVRPRALGALMVGYGVLLLGVALTY